MTSLHSVTVTFTAKESRMVQWAIKIAQDFELQPEDNRALEQALWKLEPKTLDTLVILSNSRFPYY